MTGLWQAIKVRGEWRAHALAYNPLRDKDRLWPEAHTYCGLDIKTIRITESTWLDRRCRTCQRAVDAEINARNKI